MKPMKFGIGQAVTRVEDQRLTSGRGRYTSDADHAGALEAVFLRSSHANAAFRITDIAAAAKMPGVVAVYSATDFAHFHDLPCLAPLPNSDDTMMPVPPYPVLVRDHVRHVGDAIAMVIAETQDQARLAMEAIEVSYDSAAAVVDMRKAIAAGAPLVWPQFKSNVAYDKHVG